MTMLLALVVLPLAGCGQEGEPPPSTVHGIVTFEGKPVTGGILIFDITDANGKKLPFAGEIDQQGNYELTNGMPGSAVITVDTGTEEGLPHYFPLPLKFSDPTKSGITYDVQLGDQEFDIELK